MKESLNIWRVKAVLAVIGSEIEPSNKVNVFQDINGQNGLHSGCRCKCQLSTSFGQ